LEKANQPSQRGRFGTPPVPPVYDQQWLENHSAQTSLILIISDDVGVE